MANATNYVDIARRVIQERAAKRERIVPSPASDVQSGALEEALRGQAIELWSTAAGRLFLVADEEDARLAIERFGVRRGDVYTAAEVRRIIAVNDPEAVAEIHEWKRQFDGNVREHQARKD
jgi:hypothetical protein